jgi:O-antigen ligase
LAPGLVAFGSGLLLAAVDGGYSPAVWYLTALFLLGFLALTVAIAPSAWNGLPRLFQAVLTAYAAFCLWSYLSIAWAEVPGAAWDSANRTLLYGMVIAIVGLRPWTRAAARAALTLVGIGTAALAAAVLVVSAVGDEPARLFLEGRLSAPTGYPNATAALWLIAFWPALELATGAELRWSVRGLGLAAAALLLQMAILSQSRGAAIAFAVTAALFIAIVPRRRPAVLALTAVCALAAVAWEPLVTVREAPTAGDLEPALAAARTAIGGSVALALLAGGLAAGAPGRRLAGAVWLRPLARVERQCVIGLLLVAVAAGAAAMGDPRDWAAARWHDFARSGYREVEDGESRFSGSLGSNRYDFYRVALNEFRAHPLTGIGGDNFSVAYLSERRSPEAPRHPHSLAMRLIAQLGAIGMALFLLFLCLGLAAVRRTLTRAPPVERSMATAAAAGFAFWFVHGLADWLWEFPGLSATAFALLGLAVRLDRAPAGDAAAAAAAGRPPPSAGDKRASLHRIALVGVVLVAAASLVLPGAAAQLQSSARASSKSDPAGALAKLQLASELNFASGEPLAIRGTLARRRGMTEVARVALERALDREPKSWYVELQLGLLDWRSGRRAAARERIDAAAALNPRQPVLRDLRRQLTDGAQIDERAVERRLDWQRQLKLRPVRPR